MDNPTFVIMTEVTCDLPQEYIQKYGIVTMPLTYMIEDKEYDGTLANSLSPTDFYNELRNAKTAKTAQISPERAAELFSIQLDKGFDILYIGFSSGLSGSYQSAVIAQNELKEKYPKRKIITIDSLCASLGQGLLIDYAAKLMQSGKGIEDIAKMVSETVPHICHYFTVDDLNHLYRGGRVSKTSAFIGSLLGIKPIMHVNEEGKLIPIGKIRGRRQSLDTLVDKMSTKTGSIPNEYVFISHGDSLEDAKYVADKVKEKYNIKTEIINNVGPVIGSHSGPGTIALFFMGIDRSEKAL